MNTYHNVITFNPGDNSLQPFLVLTVLETRIYVVDELVDHFDLKIKTVLVAALTGNRLSYHRLQILPFDVLVGVLQNGL